MRGPCRGTSRNTDRGFFVPTSSRSSLTVSLTEKFETTKVITPRGIRTPDRRIRNPMLYPAELWALVVVFQQLSQL